MTENRPLVIGVVQNLRHPDYPKVISYLDKEIRTQSLVAIESPWNLERIFREGENHKASQYQFLHAIAKLSSDKKCDVRPVEDMKNYGKLARLMTWYMYDDKTDLYNDKRWQRLCIQRSANLLELAKKENSDYLITGLTNAYDIKQLGHQNVTLLTQISEAEKAEQDSWIAKYGVKK